MEIKKSSRGGARVGAGRPKGAIKDESEKRNIGITYKYNEKEIKEMKDIIIKNANKKGISQADSLKEIILNYKK